MENSWNAHSQMAVQFFSSDGYNTYTGQSFKLEFDKNSSFSARTLGVLWIAAEDNFTFNSKEIDQISKFTKREFKRIATSFDPLGFLSPYTVRAKILMQEI